MNKKPKRFFTFCKGLKKGKTCGKYLIRKDNKGTRLSFLGHPETRLLARLTKDLAARRTPNASKYKNGGISTKMPPQLKFLFFSLIRV